MRVLLVAIILLAGCSDPPAPEPTVEELAAAGLAAPVWQVGQYWTFDASNNITYDIVVANDVGNDWITMVNDASVAYFDAMFDISFVGPITKGTMDGKQDGQTVRLLDFPLEHNKTWNAMWDGDTRRLVAHDAGDGKFHILAATGGAESGTIHASMLYDASVGFFRSMEFYDANGTSEYSITLTGHGTGYNGELMRYESIEQLGIVRVEGSNNAGGQANVALPETGVPEIGIRAFFACGTSPGRLSLGVDAPEADGTADPVPHVPGTGQWTYEGEHDCPADGGSEQEFVLPAVAGPWRYDAVAATADGVAEVQIELRVIEIVSL